MAKTTLQLRRGSQAENAVFTGALGEVVVDTTRKTLVVHDGATVGGTALATLASPAFSGNPTAPTPTFGDNDTSIATTAFVAAAISTFGAAPANTDSLSEGATNLYFTKNRVYSGLTAGGNITITQPGGAGTNAVITYTQPSNVSSFANDAGYLTSASILNSLSVVSTPSGALTYNNVTGTFTFAEAVSSVNGLTGIVVLNTDNISDAGRTNKWASSTTVRGYFSAGTGIAYSSGTGAISLANATITLNSKSISLTSGTSQSLLTDDITEGSTNKYASATNVRAQLSAGTGVSFTSGVISIGQAVGTTDSVTYANLTATTNLTVNTNLIKTDAGNSRVGINKTTPVYTLDVAGDVNVTGKVRMSGDAGTSGYILQSKGATASPQWVDIANSLPEIVELDRLRIASIAQSTWYAFINGTTFTDPEDTYGTQGSGTFALGMNITAPPYATNSASGSGAVSFTGTINNGGVSAGTILTVITTPTGGSGSLYAGMGVNASAFNATNVILTNTYIVGQLTATGTAAAQLTYSSGGALNATTITFTVINGVAVGQLISGFGIPDGTTVTAVSGLAVTFSKQLTGQAFGTYSFYARGGVGTYTVNQSQLVTSTGMTCGVAWLSFDSQANTDLNGTDNIFQTGQSITVTSVVPNTFNGVYTVTYATPTVVAYASTATGPQTSSGYARATLPSSTAITSINQAVVASTTINGTSLTVGSVTSGTISVGQAVYRAGATNLANLYIVSGSGLNWTLNRNPGNLGSFASLTLTSYTLSTPATCLPTLFNGTSRIIDGGNTVFSPESNGIPVAITYPIQVQLAKNGVTLSPWLNNSGSVWQNITPFGDYTVDSAGNIVFSTPPQLSDTITGTVLVGRSVNPVVKTYPFRAVDIMLGT